MENRQGESHQDYRALKERLWNQSRARQVLEKLERNRASSPILTAVAEKLAAGEHGEAEIQSAIYCELLKNRDRRAILKRVADLRTLLAKIHQDLSQAAGEIHQLQSWKSHTVMDYDRWTEFSEEVLGLSNKITDALLTASDQAFARDLDQFLQVMVKGYIVPPIAKEAGPSTLGGGRKKRDPEALLNDLKPRLERAEFRVGEEIRARKQLEKELEKARAETYRKVQEKQAIIDKLTKTL